MPYSKYTIQTLHPIQSQISMIITTVSIRTYMQARVDWRDLIWIIKPRAEYCEILQLFSNSLPLQIDHWLSESREITCAWVASNAAVEVSGEKSNECKNRAAFTAPGPWVQGRQPALIACTLHKGMWCMWCKGDSQPWLLTHCTRLCGACGAGETDSLGCLHPAQGHVVHVVQERKPALIAYTLHRACGAFRAGEGASLDCLRPAQGMRCIAVCDCDKSAAYSFMWCALFNECIIVCGLIIIQI